jgi:hypothetical protein
VKLDITASLANSAPSNAGGSIGGNNAGGGFKLPVFALPLALVCVFVFAVVWVLRK